MARTTLRRRLIVSFSLSILLPSALVAVVGALLIRERVYEQAKQRIASNLEAAKEIYDGYLTRLKDSVRIYAMHRAMYEALAEEPTQAPSERLRQRMDGILKQERLDILALLDTNGRVRYRPTNPSVAGDDMSSCPIVAQALRTKSPVAGTVIVPASLLAKDSPELAVRAAIDVLPTAKARPGGPKRIEDGMMLRAAAPVTAPDGTMVGVLVGGMLLTRSPEIVDKIGTTVFRNERYHGTEVGTATIFQGDVRIATNVRNYDGTRAIGTRLSKEVAGVVLDRGETYVDRAYVVKDWYITAYAPLRDIHGSTVGILYVGTLERPFGDSFRKHLGVLLGLSLLTILVAALFASLVAQRIAHPIRRVADAARCLAEGDFGTRVYVRGPKEIEELAESFNRMAERLATAHSELRSWADTLEKRVQERTKELTDFQANLARTERLAALGKLAAGVAHEINNPLTGVLTNASLMLADLPQDDPRRADLQTIVNETLRCRTIVKGLLDFARQTKPQKQLVELSQVVDDVVNLVRNQALFRNIVIETDLTRGVPPVVADKDQLRQVVLNIVLNAAEAMPEGGCIWFAARLSPDRERVILDITDNGPGIPPEIRNRVFEPFFSTKKTGTGLGLAIAYGIVTEHGGTLEIETPPEGGTTMRISLPLPKEEPTA